MRLTLHTDYALRVLLYLALRPDTRVSIREVARANRVSETHMVKVVHKLGRAGLIRTVRGRGGGIELGRAADGIRIGDVVRLTEEERQLVSCMRPGRENEDCVLSGFCQFYFVLGTALDAFMEVLDNWTLSDILRMSARDDMMRRLFIPDDVAIDGRAP
ncbi:RrF2 family transcriptional regulator [Novacetimonas pomaceti]|uniref:Rrf2 family transcriptional regulator n=1 Tax=Novacetimonas pomaceti TaxID=2021998 RepID=A0A318QF28_9PROT|nr:Rrf2 family transcriptional regulator [Novacetimonas pomaceti]MBV1832799.1 Rrf2 family transcriptional regulator [Novacetimonas pomaceti]PYD48975.1 Rrf2 family transcriptional regulator [Novacetimonas pomaceti]PYD76484.1 Rrf2 family transcriptional regulator [Novacetimonas pomaceti]